MKKQDPYVAPDNNLTGSHLYRRLPTDGPMSKNEAECWRRDALAYRSVLESAYKAWFNFWGSIAVCAVIAVILMLVAREWTNTFIALGVAIAASWLTWAANHNGALYGPRIYDKKPQYRPRSGSPYYD